MENIVAHVKVLRTCPAGCPDPLVVESAETRPGGDWLADRPEVRLQFFCRACKFCLLATISAPYASVLQALRGEV